MSKASPGRDEIPSRLEHTNLRPDATRADIERLCAEANDYRFRAVVVNPCRVAAASRLVEGGVLVASVCGFPLGASLTAIKITELQQAVLDGASSVDMVINVGWVKDGALERVSDEVAQAREHVPDRVELKVIIETPLLSDREIEQVAQRVIAAGANVVKTGTGMAGPVTVEQVQLIRGAVGPDVVIKAAGGIRTLEQCRELMAAGANLLGCSQAPSVAESLNS